MALHPVSGHLLNATTLALAAVVALAVDRYSAASATNARPLDGLSDVADYLGTSSREDGISRREVVLGVDPFTRGETGTEANSVASPRNSSTVSGSAGSGRQLTAILVANDRPVAVIDDEVVGVGDLLPGGARVSRIQSDRVFLIEKNGQWRTLTLAAGRP